MDPSGLNLVYFDVRRGLGCVLMADGINHCIEYIDRYWYDDGTDSGPTGGGGIKVNGGIRKELQSDVAKNVATTRAYGLSPSESPAKKLNKYQRMTLGNTRCVLIE